MVAMFSNTQVIHGRDRKFQAHKTNTYTSKHVNTINHLILILSSVILMSGGSFQSKQCLSLNATQHTSCWTFLLPSQSKSKVTLQTHVIMSPQKAFTKNHFPKPSGTDLCGSFPSLPSRAFGRLLTTPYTHHFL